MNDIQSWWEVPSVAHFCSLFRTAFNLLDFDIEDLEEALLTDGTEETSWLQELIVRLLTGCLPNNEISTFNYQMFLRRLFREKCKEHDRYNPFNTDIDFQLLPLRTKVDILHALCDFRLDAEDVLEQLKNLEADSLRVEPLGYDNNDSAYWYFYGTRLYREDFKTKNNKKGKSVWQVVCFTEDDWFQLAKKFKKSQSKSERQLYRTLTENFLPELPRLFCEKERLARKRLLENQPRRTSSRLDTKRKQEQIEQAEKAKLEPVIETDKEDDEAKRKKDLERRRQEAYERRARIRDREQEEEEEDRGQDQEESEGEKTKSRYEMAGNKKRDKKAKTKQRENSNSPSSSRDRGSSITRSATRGGNRSSTRQAEKTSGTSSSSAKSSNVSGSSTTVGRQTNNSLASATGQIVIQPVSNPHRKKLKTSQVFCQTEEDLQTGMHKILDYVKNDEDAWPFVDPVEEEFAPNYYSIIRKPMDLQRMEERLDSGYYKSFSRFRGDFQLIVDNCRLYNGVDNEYTEMVGNLLTVFEKATERYLDQTTSSDEEIAVEYPKLEPEEKLPATTTNKPPKKPPTAPRKPSLAAQTDNKRPASVISEDTRSKRSDSLDSFDRVKSEKKPKGKIVEDTKKKPKGKIVEDTKKKPPPKETKKQGKKNAKVGRKPKRIESSPVRTRSRSRSYSSFSRDDWSSSPPPSWPPSSPDSHIDIAKRKNTRSSHLSDEDSHSKFKGREKQKDKWKDVIKDDGDKRNDNKHSKAKDRSPTPPKQKDKHNKLRETIEKLKAKSELSSKLKDKDADDSDVDKAKENRISAQDNKNKKFDLHKNMLKSKQTKRMKNEKRTTDYEDENSTADSMQSDNKKHPNKKENSKNSGTKNAAIEALTLATEQTLKDINKWLDDTPRLSEFSSASNSPSHYIGAEEFDSIGSKIEHDYRKRFDKPMPKKDGVGKDIKRRTFHRDPTKFLKKREVQRTIDRLQPGKSKGNLLSNIQNTNKTDDIFPLGPLSKIKDTKNSLIVKTDESTPKLSLGSVLDSFGKHKFVDDVKKEEEPEPDKTLPVKKESKKKEEDKVEKKEEEKATADVEVPVSVSAPGKATPNLSAWFKAFGAPKVPPNQKKTETKTETKESDEAVATAAAKPPPPPKEEKKIAPPDISPNPDSPVMPQGQPAQRQRKMSTGSTVSERSSFSQDMDSPRIGIDERLGAYPAPYPSPLHRSPSGASPVLPAASPRPDVSPKATYPTVNGQIRVGFYQDTVSTKSSPDKSCSPRDNPQSPYPQYSEHVYTPTTTESATYAYNNPPYYSQSYANPPIPSYNPEQTNPPSYYDTNKPLTDQYQANQNFQPTNYPASTPSYHPNPTYETFRQQAPRVAEKPQAAMFPVKKRAYNESEAAALQQQERAPTYYETNQPPESRPSSRNTPQQYVHQNIPNPRATTQSVVARETEPTQENINTFAAPANLYNYNETGYVTERPLDLNSRLEGDKKIDMSKYTNMGYTGTDMGFSRNPPQYNYTRGKPAELQTPTSTQNLQNTDMMMRYTDPVPPTDYRTTEQQKPPDMSIPRPNYTTPTGLNVGISNISHIVDRFSTENMYYSEKGLAAPHIYSKPMVTSATSLPMFSQSTMAMPYGHDMQATQSYNRQMTELHTKPPEKKSKRRKKVAAQPLPSVETSASTNQGFQSYTGLKNTTEPSAISLKTASVVPGSAFNFGPAPTSLGLYGDKDTYPNFLEDYRTAPNYYMAAAAAAAHHRSTPDTGDKQARTAHQPAGSAAAGYPFIGAPQARPPSYPFMPPHQAPPLMDASSPLYQQYLQAGVLHQGLLGPPGAYPPGYHPALSMRQPFDSMTRPSWL